MNHLQKDWKSIVKWCGRGWDQEVLGFMPVREVLDSITTRPVILTRRCGHIATVNSPLIKLFSLEGLHGLDGSDIELGLLGRSESEELDFKQIVCHPEKWKGQFTQERKPSSSTE